jgi:hypothetical protein
MFSVVTQDLIWVMIYMPADDPIFVYGLYAFSDTKCSVHVSLNPFRNPISLSSPDIQREILHAHSYQKSFPKVQALVFPIPAPIRQTLKLGQDREYTVHGPKSHPSTSQNSSTAHSQQTKLIINIKINLKCSSPKPETTKFTLSHGFLKT